jgi:hypothetical protein
VTAARNRGKSLERTVAQLLGGERQGATGKATCDVLTPTLAVECKRRDGPGIETAWIQQAQQAGKRHGRPWLLVKVRKGQRVDGPESYAVMRLSLALQLLRTAGMIPDRPGLELVDDDFFDDETGTTRTQRMMDE